MQVLEWRRNRVAFSGVIVRVEEPGIGKVANVEVGKEGILPPVNPDVAEMQVAVLNGLLPGCVKVVEGAEDLSDHAGNRDDGRQNVSCQPPLVERPSIAELPV